MGVGNRVPLHSLTMAKKKQYYVVIQGRRPGKLFSKLPDGKGLLGLT